jgi:alkanesulfonate monooxygenase SsuD/methylene tetrahydromethanopterin reductase-like flavin-dependent oxidoreductase (luciferase family)
VPFMGQMLDHYRRGMQACKEPVGRVLNNEKGIFTFVHVAPSRSAAIQARAAWSALWYVNAAPIVFKVPRAVWYDMIRSGLHPNAPRDTAATVNDQTSLDIAPDEIPVLRLLKTMAKGGEVSAEEAHEVLEGLDSVVIGDPDHCRKKLEAYEAIGTDRMMCLMQFGQIPHEAVLHSTRLAGEALVPYFAKRRRAAAE